MAGFGTIKSGAARAFDHVHRHPPNRKAALSALEPRRRVCLYQQVQMIRLDAEPKNPEP